MYMYLRLSCSHIWFDSKCSKFFYSLTPFFYSRNPLKLKWLNQDRFLTFSAKLIKSLANLYFHVCIPKRTFLVASKNYRPQFYHKRFYIYSYKVRLLKSNKKRILIKFFSEILPDAKIKHFVVTSQDEDCFKRTNSNNKHGHKP